LITFILVLLVLTGVIWLLIPQIVETVKSLVDVLPAFFERIYNSAVEFLNSQPELRDWLLENTSFDSINWSAWIEKLITMFSGGMGAFLDIVMTAVVDLSTGIFNAILSLVFGLYCLSRKEILARQGRRLLYSLLPEKICDETIRILRMTNATFAKFISGQCLEAVILGLMFAVSMTIFRMPFMPLVSVIISVTALVPIVGAFAGCVLGAFFILVQDPILAFWFVIMFLVLQQIEGNMIYPKVVGSSIGLPGMWVLVAVAVGGDLMGIGGMLLMIPLASVLYALAREFTNKRLTALGIDRAKLNEQPQEITSRFKEKRKKKKEQKLLAKLKKVAEQPAQEE
jgi:predicted PurR-regulated permease PerM